MGKDANKCIIIGNLAKDPELSYTPNGVPVAKFTIANNDVYGSGENKREEVSFLDCVAWKKLGELIAEICKKGHKVYVETRAKQQRWEDTEGKKHSKVEFTVEQIQFLTPKEVSGQ